MKSYKNLIVLGLLVLGAAIFLTVKYVDFNTVLANAGYYEEKVTVLSTSDIHGHIIFDDLTGGYYSLDEVSTMMGMPLMKHLIDEVRKDSNNTLLLDSGDLFHGTNEANIEKGKGVVEIANMMGYDGMAPGNHSPSY